MQIIFGIIIIMIIVFFFARNLKSGKDVKIYTNSILPYKLKDNFLTNVERSFYHALKLYVGDKATICPKVGLKDVFFIDKGVGKDYMKYFGKIAQKHVDFVLCDPSTMQPLCAIELDDISHTNKKTYERDLFVVKLYKDANFELVRFSAKSGYTFAEMDVALSDILNKINNVENNAETIIDSTDGTTNAVPICSKCQIPMILRKSARGQNAGTEFYGCTNYPNCKEVKYK